MCLDDFCVRVLEEYRQHHNEDHIPSLVELVGFAVQLAEGQGLTGKQKLTLVKGVLPLVVEELPLPPEVKELLEDGLFLVEDLVVSALAIVEAHRQLQGCFCSWLYGSTLPRTPFPILAVRW